MTGPVLQGMSFLADGVISFDVGKLGKAFFQSTIDGLEWGSIYALVAVGYTLVYGVLRLINFAHSEIFMLGMFGQYAALMLLGFSPSGNAYHEGVLLTIVFLGIALVVGMLVSGGAAVGLERVAYRPLRKRNAPSLVFLITAIGADFVLQEFVHFVLPKITGQKLGGLNAQQPIILVERESEFKIGDGTVTNITLIIVIAAVLLAFATDVFVNRTKFGRGMRAVAQDPTTATLMGVSRERIIMMTFLIGGFLAGAAALLYTLKVPGGILYSGGFLLGIKAFSAAVLGGIGNLRGALLGGIVLGIAENWGQYIFGTQWKDIVAFVLLVLVLMFRPTGILGESLGEGTGMSTPLKAKTASRGGIGDRFRLWWNTLSRPAQWGIGIPFIIIIALLPIFRPPLLNTPGTDFGGVMAQFGMYALLAIGLNVVVGQAGLLDLGYVGFYAVGAYTVGLLTSPDSPWNKTGPGGWLSDKWAWLAVLPIAVAVTALSGLLLGSPTLRLRGDYLAIVTLGFGEIVRLLADNLDTVTGGGQGLSSIAYPRVGVDTKHPLGIFSAGNTGQPTGSIWDRNLNSGVWWFWLSIILIVIALMFVGNLERSRVGRAWVAIREDEDAAEIMGVPTFKFKLWAFVIGASIGGLSGALYAGQVQFVVPIGFNVINSVLFLCAVVLGGQGNKLGVILGAFIIVYLPNRFVGLTDSKGEALNLDQYKYLFFGIALMVLMIFRPQGLIPVRQKLLAMGRQIYLAARRRPEGASVEVPK